MTLTDLFNALILVSIVIVLMVVSFIIGIMEGQGTERAKQAIERIKNFNPPTHDKKD